MRERDKEETRGMKEGGKEEAHRYEGGSQGGGTGV